jgi:hypothetical protein
MKTGIITSGDRRETVSSKDLESQIEISEGGALFQVAEITGFAQFHSWHSNCNIESVTPLGTA